MELPPSLFGNFGAIPGLGLVLFGAYWGIRLWREFDERRTAKRDARLRLLGEDDARLYVPTRGSCEAAVREEAHQSRKDTRDAISTHGLQQQLLLRDLADRLDREAEERLRELTMKADSRHREIMEAIGGLSE